MGLCAHAEQVAFYGLLWDLWKKGFLDPGRPFLEGDLPLSAMLRVKSSALGSKMVVLRKLWRMLRPREPAEVVPPCPVWPST